MEFQRKKRLGRSRRTYREWHDKEGLGYRITWSTQVAGVSVIPHYYACVRSERSDGFQWWTFCQHRRPYKTLKAAVKACEFNRRICAAFVELSRASGKRTDRLAKLEAQGCIGGGNVLAAIPVWALKAADPSFSERICTSLPNQSDPSEVSKSSDSTATECGPGINQQECLTTGPALDAKGEAGSTTTTIETQSKASSLHPVESALPATEPAKAAKKPSRLRTKRSSPGGAKKSKRGTKGKRSAKAA